MRHVFTACTLTVVCCLTLASCTGSNDRDTPQPSPRPTLKLGQSADTAGVGGKGKIRMSPDTVVYALNTSFGPPEHGVFAVVNFHSRNWSKGRVRTTAEKGGFRWKAPDGKTVKARNSEAATKLAPIGFSEGGSVIAPDMTHQDVAVFDITATEKGGTLEYVDGSGAAFRWKIPASNSGSAVPALKFALN
jgi:hypothetical protein